MTIKQKIKQLIKFLSIILVLTFPCMFYRTLNPIFMKFLANRFSIVSSEDNLLVHFIDVYQADATAINFPDDKIMLIDTGTKYYNVDYITYLKENVVNSRHNNYIDYLVLSHADMDHIGGTMKLFENFKIGKVFLPKVDSSSQEYLKILNYVENNCDFKILGEDFTIENNCYSIRFFEILSVANTNDSSQLMKIECGDKSFLFTGDISMSVETKYVDKYGDALDCDVLKVSHHGSGTSSSSEFLTCVSPEYAVISVALSNSYGHPDFETLVRLEQVNAKILRTDKDRNILFLVGENYGFYNINGNFYIYNLNLGYVEMILIIDAVLLLCCVKVVIMKTKKDKLNKANNH